ncbi:MAG: hypothetical protein FWE47_04055 [Oscillospiraceae bacterium]|nr:hypothetical protein [Oscillospiraceae bacterium]
MVKINNCNFERNSKILELVLKECKDMTNAKIAENEFRGIENPQELKKFKKYGEPFAIRVRQLKNSGAKFCYEFEKQFRGGLVTVDGSRITQNVQFHLNMAKDISGKHVFVNDIGYTHRINDSIVCQGGAFLPQKEFLKVMNFFVENMVADFFPEIAKEFLDKKVRTELKKMN